MVSSLGKAHIGIGLVIVFVAIIALLYIFDSLDKLSQKCNTAERIEACDQLSGLTIPMLVILLMIGGFIMTVCVTFFLLFSPSRQPSPEAGVA